MTLDPTSPSNTPFNTQLALLYIIPLFSLLSIPGATPPSQQPIANKPSDSSLALSHITSAPHTTLDDSLTSSFCACSQCGGGRTTNRKDMEMPTDGVLLMWWV